MTAIDHDTFVLPAVRRAVIGRSLEDWGSNTWDFNRYVRNAAELAVRGMSATEQADLRTANKRHMQTFYEVLDIVEEQTGMRDIALAHMIVAMYFLIRDQPFRLGASREAS